MYRFLALLLFLVISLRPSYSIDSAELYSLNRISQQFEYGWKFDYDSCNTPSTHWECKDGHVTKLDLPSPGFAIALPQVEDIKYLTDIKLGEHIYIQHYIWYHFSKLNLTSLECKGECVGSLPDDWAKLLPKSLLKITMGSFIIPIPHSIFQTGVKTIKFRTSSGFVPKYPGVAACENQGDGFKWATTGPLTIELVKDYLAKDGVMKIKEYDITMGNATWRVAQMGERQEKCLRGPNGSEKTIEEEPYTQESISSTGAALPSEVAEHKKQDNPASTIMAPIYLCTIIFSFAMILVGQF
ncbi:hypothetical protein DFA_03571 [Cavenderia fasciculata]|uniref:Uncharacterized protein n=1 Tax=Cavenderia fasciculata TaxID=261658 RepID=F4PI39_CACFS|nr:uncharacterized protein DFA_03571 [Cavenderia fasciculata]EGG25322.1 hypothetical protein DFA_03571 [Cavenderia fasciculata]|eukprot:XP_004363173.1 hypothetical protein DFA_03571 [Cavenderia fasciculata]